MKRYIRPILQVGPARPAAAVTLVGGSCWFDHVELLRRSAAPEVVPVSDCAEEELVPFLQPRVPIGGLDVSAPVIMGILNVTPDSFSDGGLDRTVNAAVARGMAMRAAGADIIDVGGESTRPGAAEVSVADEIARCAPVIAGLRRADPAVSISIDTRKSPVARAARDAGANLVNDVSGFTFDPGMMAFCVEERLPACIMHAVGTPETMQAQAAYDDVLLDVYDVLAARIAAAVDAGLPRQLIIADPGIGFGKTLVHNLALLQRLSLFHGLGVPILLGASRKRFIGTIGNAEVPTDRMPGSIAVLLAALQHGVQIFRVHDVAETCQAVALWRASMALTVHD